MKLYLKSAPMIDAPLRYNFKEIISILKWLMINHFILYLMSNVLLRLEAFPKKDVKVDDLFYHSRLTIANLR